MALDGVDASIPLQAGRNLPSYGPDYNALAQMQRTAIAVQQAQQVQQAQNALKQFFATPDALDTKTLQPNSNALASLMRASPAAGMDFLHNLTTMQNQRLQQQHQQSEVTRDTLDNAMKIGKDSDDQYMADIRRGIPEPEATRNAQQKYTEDLNAFKASGIPESLKGRLNPTFDHIRIQRNQLTAAQLLAAENMKKEGYQLITQRTPEGQPQQVWAAPGKPTLDMGGNPITPTGMAEPKRSESPEPYIVTVPGRGDVNAVRDPMGGYREDVPGGQLLPNATHPRKIGTKGEEDASTAGQPTGPTELHGAEYLDKLPASRASLVKGYVEGRVPFPGSFSLRSPYWQKMVADITQYDPSFDAVNYNARAATRKDFTSGKSAQNITSFNTAIGHLGSLDKAAEELVNRDFTHWNTVANWLESATGDPRVVKFNTAKQAVSDELTRAFRGTGGNVYDIKGWESNLSSSNSPAQLKTAVKEAVDLLRSRIESVGEQYRRGMGTTADVMDLLTPAAKKTLGRLPGGEDLSKDTGTAVAPRQEDAPAASAASPPAPGAPTPPAAGQSQAAPTLSAVPESQRQEGNVVQLSPDGGKTVLRFKVQGGALVPVEGQ